MSPKSHLTESGITDIGVVPFGIHLCHFYPSRDELLASLIPYFEAGVRGNEQCIWIAAAPLPLGDITAEVLKSSTLQEAFERGQLQIVDAADWYGDPAALDPEQVIQRWFSEEAKALDAGYEGLRITGNTSFVPPESWGGLMDYEKRFHEQLQDRRIVACCSYDRIKCDAVGVLEVARRHHATLDRTEGRWQVFMRPA